ncbi:hypothetical protein T552_03332 [Pneumocystis carinii B80]|uniref:WHIM1 domain-containing protein n=1 Tax=Pneumocystis carinii (strain B80) TaxID=1408658 RepID=A0A0W4ZBB1_PNEC8|nr:hypothetical protein T552_03332 [Pneumocystis carinii B80]KTW25720.1 hypothetical protein T552_03332 [Pneumocystis carinii B80]
MSDSSELSSPPSSLHSVILKESDNDLSAVKSESVSIASSKSSSGESGINESFVSSLDIAYIVAFRNRFSQLFEGIPDLGPQDIERGILGEPEALDKIVELLCRLVTLCLNRKRAVQSKHFSRALSESVDVHIKHLDPSWCGYNPLHRENGFYSLCSSDKLKLLCCLVDWCLMSSEVVRSFIDENYKNRASDDKRNALLVHPLGKDGKNRKLWLIEGNGIYLLSFFGFNQILDTPFRVYRETKSRSGFVKWKSIAGTADELRQYALSLSNDSSLNAIALVPKILEQVCPRVEKAQIRRDKLEANRARLASLNIESTLLGMRTRGKRIKYTFSDNDDSDNDIRTSSFKDKDCFDSNNKSIQYTASGRMIRRPKRGDYGIYEEIDMAETSDFRKIKNIELSKNSFQDDNYVELESGYHTTSTSSESESGTFSLKVLLKYNPKKVVTELSDFPETFIEHDHLLNKNSLN